MKKLLSILSMCIAAVAALAQEKADINVSYDASYPTIRGKIMTHKMTLLASSNESKYFNDLSLWVDSLCSTPEGNAQYREIFQKACVIYGPDGSVTVDRSKGPAKKAYTYVFNKPATGELTVYDNYGGSLDENLAYYTEPLSEMTWEIVGDSVTSVLGYDCILAETDYHGRHWKAWFAPEVPVPFGPWKFHGLPGLILKVETEGGFSFTATGMEATDRLMTPMYLAENYSKTDRRNALADREHNQNNFESVMSAQMGSTVTVQWKDDDGNEIAPPIFEAQKHAIEPDYK